MTGICSRCLSEQPVVNGVIANHKQVVPVGPSGVVRAKHAKCAGSGRAPR